MSVASIPLRHIHAIFPRTNAHVLADLLIAQGGLERLRMIQNRPLTTSEDDRWTELENEIDGYRSELRAMVEQQTGMDCDALLAALS